MVRVKLTKIDINMDIERLQPAKECAGSAIMNGFYVNGAKPYHDLWTLGDG